MSIMIDTRIEIKKNLEETVQSEAKAIDGKTVKLGYRNWIEDGRKAQVYRIPYGCCRQDLKMEE